MKRKERNAVNRYAELVRDFGNLIDTCKESTSSLRDANVVVDDATLQWRRGFMAGLRRAIEITQDSAVDDAVDDAETGDIAVLEAKLEAALASIEVYDFIVADMETTIRHWRSLVRVLQRDKGHA